MTRSSQRRGPVRRRAIERREHAHARLRLLAVAAAAALVLLTAVRLFPSPSTALDPPAATPAATETAAPVIAVGQPASTPTSAPTTIAASATEPAPEPSTPAAKFEPCRTECLVRVRATEQALAAFAAHGLTAGFQGKRHLWSALDDASLGLLAAEELELSVVERGIETLSLYSVRLPEGGEATVVHELGEVIDVRDGQYIVSIPGPPPYVLELVEAGIAIEKFPPAIPAAPRSGKPDFGDPWDPAEQVSADEIERTIVDLQGMGAHEGLGTRHYGTDGNVEAAEYLFRRLLAYGLTVRYEDFVADTGRLVTNVVGELPGRDPSQTILLSAHFDTIAEDTKDPALAPGALDNGSGIAALLEVARLLSGYALPHPIQIVFFNVEEVGLQGSQEFARRAVAEGRTYAAAVNVDSVGAHLETNRLIVNAEGDAGPIQALFVAINGVNGGLGIDLWATQDEKIDSDEKPLQDAGIPTVLLASVLFGDPLINVSTDTIAQVDPFRVARVTQLLILVIGHMLNGAV